MSKSFLLLSMLFCHIVDDYNLQGWLANAKQISWWRENAPDRMYKYDWLMALAMHSMSWSFMVMLPVAVYLRFQVGFFFVWMWALNAALHGIIDDAKANRHQINLIWDQTFHIIQIIATFLLMCI